jgi:hypothetical protein
VILLCHDFHAFSALRSSDFQPATLGHNEGCVDEAFFLVQCASIAKLVGNIRQRATQNLIAAPSLKAPMHSFVVRVALRQPATAGADVAYANSRHRVIALGPLSRCPGATLSCPSLPAGSPAFLPAPARVQSWTRGMLDLHPPEFDRGRRQEPRTPCRARFEMA